MGFNTSWDSRKNHSLSRNKGTTFNKNHPFKNIYFCCGVCDKEKYEYVTKSSSKNSKSQSVCQFILYVSDSPGDAAVVEAFLSGEDDPQPPSQVLSVEAHDLK